MGHAAKALKKITPAGLVNRVGYPAPYASGMAPADDEKTFYCCGWFDNFISFIAHTIDGPGNLVEKVLALE